jgi:AraC-like DNA-binding protein
MEHREELGAEQAVAVIVLGGQCVFAVEHRERQLLTGDYVLLLGTRKTRFRKTSAANARLMRCAFSLQMSLPHPLAGQLPAIINIESPNLTDETEFGQTIAMLDREIANTRFGAEFVMLRLAEIAFVEILRRSQLEAVPQPAFLAALSDSSVRASLELIHGAPGRAWRVEELAQNVGLSRAAFFDRFHRHVGEPPLRYLRAWRMLRARRDLIRNQVSIREVASAAGYRSTSGFSRAFRRVFGYSPNALRHERE